MHHACPLQVDYTFPPSVHVSPECKDLLVRILVADPDQRITVPLPGSLTPSCNPMLSLTPHFCLSGCPPAPGAERVVVTTLGDLAADVGRCGVVAQVQQILRHPWYGKGLPPGVIEMNNTCLSLQQDAAVMQVAPQPSLSHPTPLVPRSVWLSRFASASGHQAAPLEGSALL